MDDGRPFNPFYIGPHPSKACAIPEIAGQQCSPNCTEKPQASGQPQLPDGLLIVGMAGPMGGVANVYSTGTGGQKTQATAAPGQSLGDEQGSESDIEPPKCRPYPCMDDNRNDSPGC